MRGWTWSMLYYNAFVTFKPTLQPNLYFHSKSATKRVKILKSSQKIKINCTISSTQIDHSKRKRHPQPLERISKKTCYCHKKQID